MIRKPCCSRFSLHKFVHLKFFWTQFKNVHLQGPCSSRLCISRPYCIYCVAIYLFDFFQIVLNALVLKFIFYEKATKFCEIFTLLLSYVLPVKSTEKISQNFVAFSEYMNFNRSWLLSFFILFPLLCLVFFRKTAVLASKP